MDDTARGVESLTALAFWMLVFFETANDDTFDPDTCVTQIEVIGSYLRGGGDAVRDEFRRYADHVAASDGRPEVRAVAVRAYDAIWG